MYICNVQGLNISEPNTLITNVSGTHVTNFQIVDVNSLKIDNQNMKFLPINIAEYFPDLKEIIVSNSNLEYITEKDFRGLTQLSIMFMTNNRLKDLPCGVFDTNKRLEEIHFEENSLSEIGADVFKPLTFLTVAHFRNNNCIDKDAGNSGEVEGLLNEITTKCFKDCETTRVYPRTIKELENTVNNITGINLNLTTELEALREENLKIIKEKVEQNQIFKDLEAKYNQTIENAKMEEDKFKNIISSMENNLSEKEKEIKNLKNTVTNITSINHK